MPARLRVEGTFRLKPRAMFVAHGRFVEGTIRVGQTVVAPMGIDAPVAAIEYVRTVTERRENPADVSRTATRTSLPRGSR